VSVYKFEKIKVKKTVLKLPINDAQYVTLEFLDRASALRILDYLTIAYYKGAKRYILYPEDYVAGVLWSFESLLAKVVCGQLPLHESITEDIGFLWHEYLQDKKEHNFVEKPLENSTYWVGQTHHLCESKKWDTWLYNKNDAIYFEITPSYHWHFCKPQRNEKFVSYKKFVKKYKPLAIIKIDKKVAQGWLKIVSRLLATAQKNHAEAVRQDKDWEKNLRERAAAVKTTWELKENR